MNGIGLTIKEAAKPEAASAEKNEATAEESGSGEEMVFGRVEGLSGTERTLQDILSDEEEGTSKFEIPEFLKQ